MISSIPRSVPVQFGSTVRFGVVLAREGSLTMAVGVVESPRRVGAVLVVLGKDLDQVKSERRLELCVTRGRRDLGGPFRSLGG